MKFLVKIYLKARKEIPTDELNLIKNNMLCAINNDWPCEALMVTYPTFDKINSGRYEYWFTAHIEEDELDATEVFDVCDKVYPLVMVHVRNQEYINHGDMQIGWTNDGVTAYSPDRAYYDPYYRFIFDGKETDYEVVDIKNYSGKACTDPHAMKRYEGKDWMWKCTSCWDNFMEAKTLDKALEEFEKYYHRQLWKSIENIRKRLEEATDNFAQFDDYRWRKKW